jgi:hypothetical protein
MLQGYRQIGIGEALPAGHEQLTRQAIEHANASGSAARTCW